jgi:putative transposase
MLKTYKYRLYPNREQEQKLLWTMQQCRFVYNMMLEKVQSQDKPDRYTLQNSLPLLKEQHPLLKGVYSKVLQYEVYRLFSNLKALSQSKKRGRSVGRLRFKSISGFKTLHFNQSGFKILETNKRLDCLHLSKIGDIPMRMHRPVESSLIKQVVIKRYGSGRWFASITVEEDMVVKKRQPIRKIVGLDMGIMEFLTDTTGKLIENPRCLNKSLKRLRRRQKRLSKAEKQSKNRSRQIFRVAKLHEKISDQRRDFCHKLTRYYVDTFDFISVEDLNINGMLESIDKENVCKRVKRCMRRSTLDVSWRKFFDILSYKAECAGKTIVKVDPRFTSQIYKYGRSLDRDYNASLNILERGLQKVVGQGLSEFTPLEIVPPPKLKTVLASTIVESGSHFQNHSV